MLACIHMHEMTDEPRWRALFDTQVHGSSDLEETGLGPLWTQDLYGSHQQWLGPVHGYAGNMIPLLRGGTGWQADQRMQIASAIPQTLRLHRCGPPRGSTGHRASSRTPAPRLCQHCHGAPGIGDDLLPTHRLNRRNGRSLAPGRRVTWNAGPLSKGSNSAMAPAAMAMRPETLSPHARRQSGRARQGLCDDRHRAMPRCAARILAAAAIRCWTGMSALAIYLWDCLTAETPAFRPSISSRPDFPSARPAPRRHSGPAKTDRTHA